LRSRRAHRIATLAAALAWLACGGEPAPPNIVLVTLDTTRFDHLGVYGYAGGTSPRLDAFASSADVYERAYAASSWTLPSHASIFTGLLPMEHGAQSVVNGGVRDLGYSVRPLQDSFVTLAEALRGAGYRTGAVVAGPALARELGVAQGFESYDDDLSAPRALYHGRRGDEVADLAIALVEGFGSDPYFLFVNFFDPHEPYEPPGVRGRGRGKQGGERIQALVGQLDAGAPPRPVEELDDASRHWLAGRRAGYDAEIRFMDRQLGRLLDAVAAAPRGGQTLIAITSDHGESFGEHFYVNHGAHLYEDNVRVPLILRLPGPTAGGRIEAPFQHGRMFQTLRAYAGVAPPDGVEPRGLDAEADEIVLEVQRSDLNIKMLGRHFDRDLRAVTAWPYKWIVSSSGASELYDLSQDPRELANLAARDPERAGQLAQRFREIAAERPPRYEVDVEVDLRPDTEKALRELGYIE